jgi:hypothetical protein
MGADITGWVKPNISVNLVRNMAERYKPTIRLAPAAAPKKRHPLTPVTATSAPSI